MHLRGRAEHGREPSHPWCVPVLLTTPRVLTMPHDDSPAALWIRCEQCDCCRAGSCGWGERSKVSTPAVRRWLNGAFISLSDPDLSAGHQEKKPERWGGEHGTRSTQPSYKPCHLFLQKLKTHTICITPQQPLWDMKGVQSIFTHQNIQWSFELLSSFPADLSRIFL